MPERFHFTKKALADLPLPPPGKRAYCYDTKTPGLLVCVTDHGVKSFQVYRKVKGKPLRVTLGHFPNMTIEQARRMAQGMLSRMADGVNPLAEKKANKARSLTLQQIFEAYLQSHTLKPCTLHDYRYILDHAFADWQDKPILEISRDMVERRHALLGKRSEARANGAMRVLRALFNFAAGKYEDAEGRPLLLDNPTKRLSATRAWYRVERRQTVIKPYQLKPWFEAVIGLKAERATGKAAVVRDYLLLLLFTGLRRGEAARLRWQEVNLDYRTFRVTDTKNRRAHELPLSDFLLKLLIERKAEAGHSPFVFPGDGHGGYLVEPRRWIEQVIQQSGVEFTLHDLRRTFATIAESLDIPAYALKRLLNHKTEADVTAGYLVIDAERLREPMQKITDFILKAAGIKGTADILSLRFASE